MKRENTNLNIRFNPSPISENKEIKGEILKVAIFCPPLTHDARVLDAFSIFMNDHDLRTIAVVDTHNRPLGALLRYEFLERVILGKFGYGFSLNSKKSVRDVMRRDILIIDGSLTLEEAGAIVSTKDFDENLMDIIVCSNGVYRGILPIKQLLYFLSEKTLKLALEANPLTGLPGNWSIKKEVEERLDKGIPFEVVYIDINDFKPYNDKYGFAAGDRVIQRLGEILKNLQRDFPEIWIGHIGGDDFVMIAPPNRSEDLCQKIVEDFENLRGEFHDPDDLVKKHYESLDRLGQVKIFNLLSLSCAIIPSSNFSSFGELSSRASEVKIYAKSLAKSRGNSSIARDRRHNQII